MSQPFKNWNELSRTTVLQICNIIDLISSWTMKFLIVLINFSLVLSSPEILVSPESANVINGDSVVFQCIARADNVIFFVNGTLAAEQIVVDKGFNEMSIMEVNETTKNRTLTATALTQYNNTTIICSASIIVNLISNGTVLSDPAILHVQDSLPPNAILSSFFIDLSTVNISWSPPFALPSTSVAEYNISVTSSVTAASYFTSDSYFVIQLSNITVSPCDEINVTVSRYNTVSGIISMPVVTFYPPSVALSGSFSPSVMVDLNETDMLVGVTFSIYVSDLCPREYPEHVEIRVFTSDNQTIKDEHTFPVSVSGNAIIVEDAFTLDSNERYRAEVFFQNHGGNFSISGAVNFSTFAIQSVQINESSTLLEVECVFAPNTEAIGCEVKITFSLNNEVIGNKTMRANRTEDSALLTFPKVFADEYLLYVFEIEKTGSVVQVHSLTALFTLSTQQFTLKSVSKVLSATPILFQITSSTNLIIGPSVSSSMESGGDEDDDDGQRTHTIIIATVVSTTCIITAGGFIVLVVVLVRTYSRRRKNNQDRYFRSPTEETNAGRSGMLAQIGRQKATFIDSTSVAKFSLRKSLWSSNTGKSMLFSNENIDQEISDNDSDDGFDDDMTSTSSSGLLLQTMKSYTKNLKKFDKHMKSQRQQKSKTKKKKVPHSYDAEFDMSTTESILLMMDEDTLDEYSTSEQSEDSDKLEASEYVLKKRRTIVTDPAEDSQMDGFSPGTQDEKNKAEKEYMSQPETFDEELESSEILGKNKSQDQKIEVEVVVVRQSPKTRKTAPKEGGVYASLSDFKGVPEPRLTNDSVTYVDPASLRPSWQPPVPTKRNRMGKTSQGDPFLGESQQDQSTAL